MNVMTNLFQVAETIWICEKQTVNKWDGNILSYKEHLKAKVMKDSKKNAKGEAQDQQELLKLIVCFQRLEWTSLQPTEVSGKFFEVDRLCYASYYVNIMLIHMHIFLQ